MAFSRISLMLAIALTLFGASHVDAHWKLKRVESQAGNSTNTGVRYNKKNSLCAAAAADAVALTMLKGEVWTPVGGIAHGSTFMNVWFSPGADAPSSKKDGGTLWRKEDLRGSLKDANVGPPSDAPTGKGTLMMCQKDVYCQCVDISIVDVQSPAPDPNLVPKENEDDVNDPELADATGPDDIVDEATPCGDAVNGFCPSGESCSLTNPGVTPYVWHCVVGDVAREDGGTASATAPTVVVALFAVLSVVVMAL